MIRNRWPGCILFMCLCGERLGLGISVMTFELLWNGWSRILCRLVTFPQGLLLPCTKGPFVEVWHLSLILRTLVEGENQLHKATLWLHL